MKIAIVWHWKMWQQVEQCAWERWDEVVAIIDWVNQTVQQNLLGKEFDVIIEFSSPESVLENVKFYVEQNYKVIMATTWWWEQLDEVKQLFEWSDAALLWSGNFSIGVQLFYKIIDHVSQLMNQFEIYDVSGHEWHHKRKADSPSGTLINIWDIILKNTDMKTAYETNTQSHWPIAADVFHMSSTRWWYVPGTHQVTFDSPFDTIDLTHTARTREWFAFWSLMCGEWLKDKTWYFEISDFTDSLLKNNT